MVTSWSPGVHIQFQQVLIVQPKFLIYAALIYAVGEAVVGVQRVAGGHEGIQAVETRCCNSILVHTLAALGMILH
jgi:hypothetical protein